MPSMLAVMEADASRYHGKTPDEIDWSLPQRQTRAVAEFLSAFEDDDAHADRKRASKHDCTGCALKSRCAPNTPQRKIPRDVNEHARDFARSLVGTEPFVRSQRERKKIEMRFAHLKTHHRFERMRLRGLSGARDEFHLAAIVQNLKRLATPT